ncbi:MAG: hypothetical protein QWI36_01085 [Wolbachia endosymbiont of Tyrophagus putrescentiae]|nr:hypothetical protein [Wolbachia endosymbiont of Tyrophagus putrescentiae]
MSVIESVKSGYTQASGWVINHKKTTGAVGFGVAAAIALVAAYFYCAPYKALVGVAAAKVATVFYVAVAAVTSALTTTFGFMAAHPLVFGLAALGVAVAFTALVWKCLSQREEIDQQGAKITELEDVINGAFKLNGDDIVLKDDIKGDIKDDIKDDINAVLSALTETQVNCVKSTLQK